MDLGDDLEVDEIKQPTALPEGKTYYDHHLQCLVRATPGGLIEAATAPVMVPRS